MRLLLNVEGMTSVCLSSSDLCTRSYPPRLAPKTEKAASRVCVVQETVHLVQFSSFHTV